MTDKPWGKMIPVADVDVWRAAQQMIKLFQEDASIQAALRSDAALDEGDLDNHRLWLRVTNAINELQRSKRIDGENLN